MSGHRITVVVPTYRRPERLAPLVDALAAQTLDPSCFDVIMIDNSSQDDTWDVLEKLATDAPFELQALQTPRNRGPAPARNLGWRSSGSPIIAFLDDDCLPDPDWLANGLAAMERDDNVGVLQGRVRVPSDFDPSVMGTWYHCMIIEGPTPYFESCNIFYRRAALEQTHGFDEELGWWGEDSALGWKVLEAGWSRGFANDAVVSHSIQERGWRWYVQTGLLERNTLKVAKLHPGFRQEAFWRSWAYRREDVVFLLAVLGLLLGRRVRPALVLTLPYLWKRRPRPGLQGTFRFFAQNVAVDGSRLAGQLWGAVAHQVLVI